MINGWLGWGWWDVAMASKWMWMHAYVCVGGMCVVLMMVVVGLATAGE